MVSVFASRGAEPNPASGAAAGQPGPSVQEMGLEECLKEAMRNNHRRPASKFAVMAAEAQHRQALAAYWPQINASGGYERMSQSPNFLFPATTTAVPAETIKLPAGTAVITVPAGVLGPTAVQLPVSTPAQTIKVPAQQFPVAAENVKLMNPDVESLSASVTWLLFDGGMRKGYSDQTSALVDTMKQECRRTDLEIVDSVKRFYYGAVLARQLHQLGDDTLARMEATLNLTETMYKEGSGRVKKTDFLENKIMVESLRAMVTQLEKNETMAQAALANTMGLSWKASIKPAEKELAYAPVPANLDDLVSASYEFSPDWAKIEAGIRASEASIRTARSDYFPKVAITGDVHKFWNSYDAGVSTERDKQGWTLGVGIEIPIFNGFLTRNKVAESRANLSRIKEEQFLLKEGLALQIKDFFLSIGAAQKAHQATLDAMTAAQEDRDLTTRAYQNELVETEKVIRAQLMEALMSAQYFKTCYDHLALQSQLNLLVGAEVVKRLQNKM
jgi:outer membrane protein TolC